MGTNYMKMFYSADWSDLQLPARNHTG